MQWIDERHDAIEYTEVLRGMTEAIPEIKVVNRSLLISHVNVEGEEVDGCQGLPAEDFEESWQAVSIEVGMRRRSIHYRHE